MSVAKNYNATLVTDNHRGKPAGDKTNEIITNILINYTPLCFSNF